MGDLNSDGAPDDSAVQATRYYKRDFWWEENLKFSKPHHRLEKMVQIINRLAPDKDCTILDVGCGPATLRRLLSPHMQYYGIDIAIQEPAPYLLEADLVEEPIKFGDKHFDIVVAQGVFEYLGDSQSQKFAEIAELLKPDGTFVVSYWNFGHYNMQPYQPFSNISSLGDFKGDLARHFTVSRSFPASHNWHQSSPNRKLLRAINMHMNVKIPVISRLLAVEYIFICHASNSGKP